MKIGNRTVRIVVDDTIDQEAAREELINTVIYCVTGGDIDGYLKKIWEEKQKNEADHGGENHPS